TPTPGVFEAISSAEYWDLDRSPGSTMEARVRLYFRDFGRSGITNINNVLVAHYNGAEWVNEGGTPTNQTVRGSVLSNTLTSFSPLSSGGTDEVVTPVNLLYFEGRKEGNVNQLVWETVSEVNNSHFEIYRSFDGDEFELIGEVEGANATNGATYEYEDSQHGSGQYFYRLKQVDFDGQYEWFNTVMLNVVTTEEAALAMYPNPLEQDRILHFNIAKSVNESQQLTFEMLSLSGRTVYQTTIDTQSTQFDVRIPSSIKEGVYVIRMQYLGRYWTQKLLVK
ncbi:MAG: T9SS type A sorting domain-containing protein, partial [Bacteroidota bacterium]